MNDIRKLSMGPDYKNAMHYQVGQSVISGTHVIHAIRKNIDGGYDIFIENQESEVFKWKTITSTIPTIVEYNIDFE